MCGGETEEERFRRTFGSQLASSQSGAQPAAVPVLIMGELVDHRPCGVSVIRVKQDGVWHKIGVDRASLRKFTESDQSMSVKRTELKRV